MSAYRTLLSGLALALGLSAAEASAQSMANLLADSLTVTPEGDLLAQGHVEAYQDGLVLSASALRYNKSADRMTISGPILVRYPDGTVLAAEAATLTADLRLGLLRAARTVLNNQLQLASASLEQTEGFKDLRKVAATSCSVCGTESPLWQIRASRVVHDEEAQQIYFENAQFLVKTLPVFWFPLLRVPDPDLARARGWLSPRIRSTSQLGLGIMLPYFVPLGASRDITITPYFSAEHGALEMRYRQAFEKGWIEATGLLGTDHRDTSDLRSYAELKGGFTLGPGRRLIFETTAISDDTILSDYGVSTSDRIESKIELTQFGEDLLGWARVTSFDSLRAGDTNGNLPPLLADLHFERDYGAPKIGGRVTLGGDISSLWRTESEAEGRVNSMTRLMAFADWDRQDTFAHGFQLEGQALLRAMKYNITGNNEFENSAEQLQTAGAATLTWPLARHLPKRTELLTPIVSLGWAGITGDRVPNEDSLVAELDGSNLHALSRLPGEDNIDEGWRLSYGVNWSVQYDAGTSFSLGFGQIRRADDLVDLPSSSGLQGQSSDLMIAGEIDLPQGFGLDLRAIVAEDFREIGKSELRFDWAGDGIGFAAAYVHLPEDALENRKDAISQWQLYGNYRLNDRWNFNAETRYDFAESQPIKSGIGIQWRNECVELGLSIARRHASNDVLEPSTDFDLSVNLAGFTTARTTGRVNTQCRS